MREGGRLQDPPEMGADGKGRPWQVICYRAGVRQGTGFEGVKIVRCFLAVGVHGMLEGSQLLPRALKL